MSKLKQETMIDATEERQNPATNCLIEQSHADKSELKPTQAPAGQSTSTKAG